MKYMLVVPRKEWNGYLESKGYSVCKGRMFVELEAYQRFNHANTVNE